MRRVTRSWKWMGLAVATIVAAACHDSSSEASPETSPTSCSPPCGADEACIEGQCVAAGCSPECGEGQHCEGSSCVGNVCDPPCAEGEICLTHGGSDCHCPTPPCDDPPSGCNDGLDGDGDGWIDAQDPDCASGDEEIGLGTDGCNDGVDNDGDGGIDSQDPQCTSATGDEVTGDGPCADDCLVGAEANGRSCQLWDRTTMGWIDGVDDGDGQLHNRARVYTAWLRERLMPVGGVMRGMFADASFDHILAYAGTRDSPIWTGTYLASEALRYMATGAPDAAAQIDETVRVLDRWWRISGDRGWLARYAAPTSSPQAVLDIFDPNDPEMHLNVPFENDTWHWRGNTSRDQYQGTMLGYSLAYEATADDALKEIIRSNVVSFIEQLMVKETRQVDLVIDGIPLPMQLELQHVVYTDDETPGGVPRLTINTSPFELIDEGFLTFWPDPGAYLPIPSVYYLRSQAVQLGSMFRVALQVTEGVPAYAARRQAIAQHYEDNIQFWLDLSAGWVNTNQCGGSYHGLNIAWQPAYSWTRLESDPTRKNRLQTEVLRDAMWGDAWDHKNVFFAFIYASQAAATDDVSGVISLHADQLGLFPAAPNTARAVDNSGQYPEDSNCPGMSSVAIDIDDRVPSAFMWERNPWKLAHPGYPNFLYPGVDYLVAYWMARHYGFIADDSPGICLRWRDS